MNACDKTEHNLLHKEKRYEAHGTSKCISETVSEHIGGSRRRKALELFGHVCRGYCKCAIDRLALFKQESKEDVKILFMFPVWKEEDQS